MKIVTDSAPMEAVKDPSTCNVYALFCLFATVEEQAELAERYRAGGLGYGHAKQALFESMDRSLEGPRDRYETLAAQPELVAESLAAGAERARKIASNTMERVRNACGLGFLH
jgi:tryptophanyl-tRNA synthetase